MTTQRPRDRVAARTRAAALVAFAVVLVGTAAWLGPVALFAIAWGAPAGLVGVGAWCVAAAAAALVALGRSWARPLMLVLPAGLVAVALAAADAPFLPLVIAAAAVAAASCAVLLLPLGRERGAVR